MSKKLETLLSGALGNYFDPLSDDESSGAVHGYAKKVDDEYVQLEILIPDDDAMRQLFLEERNPRAEWRSIGGSTQHGSLLLLDQVGSRSSLSVGGFKSSVDVRRFTTAVSQVNFTNLKSDRVRAVSCCVSGINRWAGNPVLSQEMISDGSGRLKSFALKGNSVEPTACDVDRKRRIQIKPGFKTLRNDEEHITREYVLLTIEYSDSQNLQKAIQPLLMIQDLLRLTFGRPFKFWGCQCRLETTGDAVESSDLWNKYLNHDHLSSRSSTRRKSSLDPALVSFESLGGIAAVAKWLRFYERNPRFVAPLARMWRYGELTVEGDIMNLAVAMEQYVAGIRRRGKPNWAQDSSSKPSVLIAKRLKRPAQDWLGDTEEWGMLFWRAYDVVKHSSEQWDPEKLWVLSESARVVLTAFVFDYISDRASAKRAVFAGPENMKLGEQVRDLVGESNIKNETPRKRRQNKKK